MEEVKGKRSIKLAGKNYPPKRFIVCGPRKWPESMYFWVWLIVHGMVKRFGDDIVIITGGASGVDTLAHEAALYFDLETEVYEADWKRHPQIAGPIRNQQMIDEGKPDWIYAIGYGRGTLDMTSKARTNQLMVTWRAHEVTRFETPARRR